MSSHQYVYAGAYIGVKQKDSFKNEHWIYCANDQCEKNKNKKQSSYTDIYCGKCGSKMAVDIKQVPNKEDIISVMYEKELDHSLYSHDFALTDDDYLPLVSSKVTHIITFSQYEDNSIYDITKELIEEEIKIMEDKNKDVLVFLRDYLGENNVVVRWGILSYWN